MPHTVHVTEIINAPIDKVWKIIRDFNGLAKFHPAIKSSRMENGSDPETVGSVRYLTLETGFVRDELLMLDDNTYAFDYAIIESSLPLENYIASVRLQSNLSNDQTICEWWADFDIIAPANPEEIIQMVAQGVFRAGFRAIATKIANSLAYH
ncbi:MAG: hypothetical protein A3E88_00945 [Legionellales bacterium RIFCSPHIGHO2_12_FULL_35_11]|nr:MAG: hypothetical protein A3E88_00945 [Legionellales bacterium RIFCSPHIGHO2_12_FULL_35_11]